MDHYNLATMALAAALASCAGPAPAEIRPFQSGERIAFLGDSITHGGSYVSNLQVAWKARHPESRPVFLNAGNSGDTAKTGLERLEADLAPMRPDRVVVMFGMNDVCHGGKSDFYREWMVKLCDALDDRGWKVDLMTPTPYDEWNTNLTAKVTPSRCEPALKDCAAFARDLAAQRGYGIVELYDPLVVLLKAHQERRYMPDRVHPGKSGHLIITALIMVAAGEVAVDPDTIMPKEMSSLADRLRSVQGNRRAVASFDRKIRGAKIDPGDREAVFAMLDNSLENLKKRINASEAKWHEGYIKNFKEKLYGRGQELEEEETAVREKIFAFPTPRPQQGQTRLPQ